ncbi:MAG TPA: HD domain-containing protein, partial [Blastocatellia bacterium]|nr:HD domain-containing protein [Blastocatellia bacterium]
MAFSPSGQNGPRESFFAASISAVGMLLFAYSAYEVATGVLNFEWALLAAVTVLLVSRIDIGLPRISSTVTLSDAFIFISVLVYGTYPSVILAGADAAICSLQYKSRRTILWFNVAVMSISVFISSTVVRLIFGPVDAMTASLSQLFITAGTLALLHYILNSGIVSIVTAIRSGKAFIRTWKDSFLWTSVSYFAGAAAACLIVKLISVISFFAFIIAVPIVTITYFTYKVYLDKVDSSNRHAEQMADLHLRTIEALAIAIDAKDEVTHDHVHRVQIYATGLAQLFGLSDDEIEALKAGALLHDIGKLAVPDYI